jgi:hypothetical protein
MQKQPPKSFWITNITKMNVGLYDLNFTIPPYSSVNLLDSHHFSFTIEEIQKSATSGSIYKKRDKIVVREKPPIINKKNLVIVHSSFPSKERSLYSIKQEKYEELEISDAEYAEQNADFADLDQKSLKIEDNNESTKPAK